MIEQLWLFKILLPILYPYPTYKQGGFSVWPRTANALLLFYPTLIFCTFNFQCFINKHRDGTILMPTLKN